MKTERRLPTGIVVVAGLWTLLHLYVGQRLFVPTPLGLGWRLLGWAGILLLVLAPFVALGAARSERLPARRAIEVAGFTAMGLSSLLIVVLLAGDVLHLRAWLAPGGGPGPASDPAAAVAGAPESDVRVLLAHQPKSAFAARAVGFDLQLSGHTHGGQYFPFNLLVRLFQPFVAGLQSDVAVREPRDRLLGPAAAAGRACRDHIDPADARLASRLNGPLPKYAISSAAPSMDRFFMNIASWMPRIIGSLTAQKLCIASVTGTRKMTRSHAPILAL